MKNFRYLSPRSLDEALSLYDRFGGEHTYFMAGGTDLLVRMKRGNIMAHCVMDLKRVPDMALLQQQEGGGLILRALTPLSSVEKSDHVRTRYIALSEAASSIGSVQVRNKGTVGGNLCNASPSGDMAPALLVLNAWVRMVGKGGERRIALGEFFLGPGKTILQKGEILLEVQVPPLPPGAGCSYLKFSRRRGMDLAIVGVACLLVVDRNSRCETIRIALGAVAPTPMRAKGAEALASGKTLDTGLIAKVAEAAAGEASPISDIRATAEYRSEMIKVLVRRAVEISLSRTEPSLKPQRDDP